MSAEPSRRVVALNVCATLVAWVFGAERPAQPTGKGPDRRPVVRDGHLVHRASNDDRDFRRRFEACELSPPFSHGDRVRLAYVYLTELSVREALPLVRGAPHRFLHHHAVDPAKYYETLTQAWLPAVRHFMELGGTSSSAAVFLECRTRLLDSTIMIEHYTPARLFSEAARVAFVEPDRIPIPRYPD